MNAPVVLDADWLADHPFPDITGEVDKNSRGRVLVVGGAQFVPGALRLTGEAALRAGAGKLQLATVAPVAMALGVLVPEAAMVSLPADANGEIDVDAASILENLVTHCDTLVLGPGMTESDRTTELVRRMISRAERDFSIVLDAAAIGCARSLVALVVQHEGRIVMTPHHGELASLTGWSIEDIAKDTARAAQSVADEYRAVVALKSSATVLAAPAFASLRYTSNCVGLATGGSGDVLAGAIGGLLARGLAPFDAAAWGIWAHGEAGRNLTAVHNGTGFLARELLAELPLLLNTGQRLTAEH